MNKDKTYIEQFLDMHKYETRNDLTFEKLNTIKTSVGLRNIHNVDAEHGETQKQNYNYSSYTLKKCLEVFEELLEKEIGNIFIGGSVALHLQGILDRTEYSDLDLNYSGDLELDDEFEDYHGNRSSRSSAIKFGRRSHSRRMNYYKNVTINSYIYNEIILDFFKTEAVDIVNITYNGKIYPCLHYKNILKHKLDAALANFKDKNSLLNNIIEINIK